MTPDQRRIADRVGKAAKALGHFNGRDLAELKLDPLFRRAESERYDAFTAAIRAGLLAYPLVWVVIGPWLNGLDRDVLRRIQRGLETGVRRTLPMQLRPTAEDARIIELHLKKYSDQHIVEVMHLKISRQAVRKRLKKLGYVEPPR